MSNQKAPADASASLPKTKEIVDVVFGAVKEYSKLAGQIPADDYDYHLAFPGFRRRMREQSEILIDTMNRCGNLLPKRRRVTLQLDESAVAGGVGNINEVQRMAVMEAVDSLLESVDTVLDDVRGRRLRAEEQLSITFGSELAMTGATTASAGSASGVVQVAHVRRPQMTFATPVDNSPAPFVPVYHDAEGKVHTGVAGEHPFEAQIRAFNPPQEQLLPHPETPYLPLTVCPLRFVDTPEALAETVAELQCVGEIAVDLEHHDFYSYQGFTCLMQISSRTTDYIVDCLKLRSSMHLLAPVFLDEKILKVFHGAREDVRWLQKDFALYLVNFFDTGIALQTLHMPHSLAFAVDHFCQVKLNKKYQTADWRVRPLSAEMVHYARQDTHFLLYIYDRLKALLLNSEGRASVGNLLLHVYHESRRLSLDQYRKPELDPDVTYKLALGRSLGGLSAVQERVAKDIFNWRDAAAREADDSPTAVLPLSSVLSIASKLPTTAKDLLRCCSPVSAVLRANVAHVVQLVRDALANEGAHGDAHSSTTSQHPGHVGGEEDGASRFGEGDRATAKSWATVNPLLRPGIGVHRAMTGTLPSTASSVAPALPLAVAEDEAAALQQEATRAPSTWLCAMRQLSGVLAARPAPHVQLPGNDVLLAMQRQKQKVKEEQAAAAAKQTAAARRSQDAPQSSSEGDDDEERQPDVASSAPGVEAEAPSTAAAATSSPALFEGAVALRQAFGTGASNRKKAKKTPRH